jgi:calcineurin-like phosphoesterase family protein
MRSLRVALLVLLVAGVLPACNEKPSAGYQPEVVAGADNPPLPVKSTALRFAIIGDSGRWSKQQRELAHQLIARREQFPYDFVLMLGDNNYGDGSPESYRVRFEEPYKPLIDAGVKFYAALGNHDTGPQWDYQLFNMQGHRYYTFEEKPGVPLISENAIRFFVLDTNNLDAEQVAWFDRELSGSKADWKIVILHHPIYSSGRYAWTTLVRRRTLEPLMVKNGVDLVLAGHEHVYERLLPQNGIVHFTSGAAGSVRVGDLRPSPFMAKGYDRDLSFMLAEISGDTLYFQSINREGETVDSGRITKSKDQKDRKVAPTIAAPSPETRQPTAARPENPRP